MYKSPLAENFPIFWTKFNGGVPTQGPYMHDHTEIPWSPRTGHAVALEGGTTHLVLLFLCSHGVVDRMRRARPKHVVYIP